MDGEMGWKGVWRGGGCRWYVVVDRFFIQSCSPLSSRLPAFSLFCSKKKRLLVNLAHFLKFIMSEF